MITLAREVSPSIEKELHELFPNATLRPLEIESIEPTKIDKRYPAAWSLQALKEGVNKIWLVDGFDFMESWWNFEPNNFALQNYLKSLTLRQQLITILSHELTHVYITPSNARGWFQEMIAMNVGFAVAGKLDPKLAEFPRLVHIKKPELNYLTSFDYKSIYPPNIQNCREFEFKAYLFGAQYSLDRLVNWVNAVKRDSPQYLLEALGDDMYSNAKLSEESDLLILQAGLLAC